MVHDSQNGAVHIEAPIYSDEEKSYRRKLIEEITRARDMRELGHDEFDGMTYTEYYQSNARAANSYIPPKHNRQDTRIVTGTTQEKGITLLSALLNYNFTPNVRAYDEDDKEEYELGEAFEALIKKSNEIEEPSYEQKRVLIYKEALDQGDAFVEDLLEEHWTPEKLLTSKNWLENLTMKKMWEERGKKVSRQLSSNLIPGVNVYPGNIKSFYIQKQPYIFMRKLMSRAEAEAMFGEFPRWKNVPERLRMFNEMEGDIGFEMRDWSLEPLKDHMVEILQYQNKWTNEYMIMCNGIMMLPVGFPLSALTGQNEYTVVKFAIEPISEFFFYSKSVPAKTKIDQTILDEFYKLILLKTRQSFMPPMANNTGRQLSEKIFYPATITENISPQELQPLVPAAGVTQAEFAMIQFIKSAIDSKSVSQTFQGQLSSGRTTAREILETQKQQMMKLGLTILGAVLFETSRSYLRLYNILKYWTEAQDKKVNRATKKLMDIYKRIEVEDTFEDGTSGIRVIEFSEEAPSPEQIFAEEKLLSRPGRQIRKTIVSPAALKNVRIKWKIIIEPTEKDSDALERAQFEESMAKALQFFGDKVNRDYLQKEFAKHAKWDNEKAFIKSQPLPPPAVAAQGAKGQIPGLAGATPRTQQPSLNTLLNA